MSVRERIPLAALAVAVLAVVAAAAGASAAGITTTVEPDLEAWYRPDPTCTSAAGCFSQALAGAPPQGRQEPPSAYPPETLHVGWTGTAETARSYLAFDVNDDRMIVAASLTVPLDVTPANGDARSSTARVRVCLATEDFTEVEGSVGKPPAVDCTANTVLEYVATPSPRLVGNLAPLLSGLATRTRIALLPVANSAATDAWHVTFSTRDRADAGKTPPASLRITLDDEDEEEPTFAPVVGLGPTDEPPLVELESPSEPDRPRDVDPSIPQVEPASSVPIASSPPEQVGAPAVLVTETFGYAYPGLWLLPLVLLVAVPVVVRALTKNLEPSP